MDTDNCCYNIDAVFLYKEFKAIKSARSLFCFNYKTCRKYKLKAEGKYVNPDSWPDGKIYKR